MAGPYGGDWLLTSGGPGARPELTGSALSAPIVLPSSGHLEVLVGFAGRRPRGLSLQILEQGEGRRRTVALPIPAVPHALATARWEIDPSWAGVQIRIRLGDESPEALLYLDDVWVVDGG